MKLRLTWFLDQIKTGSVQLAMRRMKTKELTMRVVQKVVLHQELILQI